eukprot:4492462-Amphidinium_carterae.1
MAGKGESHQDRVQGSMSVLQADVDEVESKVHCPRHRLLWRAKERVIKIEYKVHRPWYRLLSLAKESVIKIKYKVHRPWYRLLSLAKER